MMTRTLRVTHLLAAMLVLLAAVPPAQAGLRLFGKSDETRMGRDVARELEGEYGVWDDAEANARVKGIADKVTAIADTRGFEMQWKILDTKEVNAVAVPGGFMYVTRGLLELTPRPSDDELAFVIGHETGHIARRHSMDQLEKNLGWAVVISIIAKGSTAQFAGNLAQQLLASGYSRSDEREADAAGFDYMVKAGYDPRGSISFMRRLMALSHGSEPPKIFASHPPSRERLDNMQRRLEELGPIAVYLTTTGAERRLTDEGVAEVRRIALQNGDLGEGREVPAPTVGGRVWPVFEATPTRAALLEADPAVTARGLRQAVPAAAGGAALQAYYIVFDTPEAAHWALLRAVLADDKAAGYQPAASPEVDEIWRARDGGALFFRKGEVVAALSGPSVAADGDQMVAAIARRVPMPAPSTELAGAPTLLTDDTLLSGEQYLDVRDNVIGLSTDAWRALGVTATVKGSQMTLQRDTGVFATQVNSEKAEANGAEIDLEAASWAVKGRVYLPTKEAAEALGLDLLAAPGSALVKE